MELIICPFEEISCTSEACKWQKKLKRKCLVD